MTQDDYFRFHEEMCDTARALARRKNQDYAAPDSRKDDPYAIFANFMQSERLNICSVEAGFMVRLSDKLSRMANLTRAGHEQAVADEKLEDTVLDVINYSLLLLAYTKMKRERFDETESIL
jgi:hypothetical protein